MDTPVKIHTITAESIPYTKASGGTARIDVPLVEIPAGTILFRGLQLPNPKKDEDPRLFVRDWLGYPMGERFCMTPTHNTFFYTSPFVPFGAHTVGEWFNAIMVYQTVKTLKLVCMIGPSKWVRGGKEIKALDGTAPIQRCDKFDYSCLPDKQSKEAKKEKEMKAWDNCIRPEFAQEKGVAGWMAIADFDSLDNFKEALKGKDTTMGKYIIELESRLPGKGIDLLTSTYTDESNHRGFPEIVLFPWSPHPGPENQYTEARTEEDAADAIAGMSDMFNYLPIACITERGILEAFTGDFKAGDLPAYATSATPGRVTRAAIDKNLANYLEKLQTKGVEIPGLGNSLVRFDQRTGFYVMDKFLPDILSGPTYIPYSMYTHPLETPEQREQVLEYKIRYRTFDAQQMFKPDTLVSGTYIPQRLFIFERPDELFRQYKELGLKFPASFIPYIYGATERYQKNLADQKIKTNARGAEEALRRAGEARKKLQESLAILARKKAEREAKKKGLPPPKVEAPPAETLPASPPYRPSSPAAPPSPFTGMFQTSIPVLRTMQEALQIGGYVLQQPYLAAYQQLNGGLKGKYDPLPFEINEGSLNLTLSYIFEVLHQNCYMLCVVEAMPYLFKLEGGGLPDTVATVLGEQIREKRITDIDLDRTRVMQCIVKPYQDESTVAEEWLTLVQELARERYEFPNGIFILNLSDSMMLRTDGNAPWTWFKTEPLPRKYKGQMYLPIFSYSGHVDYDDMPIPNFDDLFEIKRDDYGAVNVEATMGGPIVTNWAEKKPKAVFRGGTTGCGFTAETNQRLHLTSPEFLGELDNAEMLDVGITTVTKQYKMDPKMGLGKVDPAAIEVVEPVSMAKQSEFKFIIHVDGNVFAYRFLKSMLTGSCILRVDSPYRSWVDSLMVGFHIETDPLENIPGCQYISVKADLSNLDAVLDWCKAHDAECKTIASTGAVVAQGILNKSYINTSLLNVMNIAKGITLAGGGYSDTPKKKPNKTRKGKKSKRRTTRRNIVEKEPLVLAKFEGGGIDTDIENYVHSTMQNLWKAFLQKNV
jgi:hypothetical protein